MVGIDLSGTIITTYLQSLVLLIDEKTIIIELMLFNTDLYLTWCGKSSCGYWSQSVRIQNIFMILNFTDTKILKALIRKLDFILNKLYDTMYMYININVGVYLPKQKFNNFLLTLDEHVVSKLKNTF